MKIEKFGIYLAYLTAPSGFNPTVRNRTRKGKASGCDSD